MRINAGINLNNAHLDLTKFVVNRKTRTQSVNPSVKSISDKESIDFSIKLEIHSLSKGRFRQMDR